MQMAGRTLRESKKVQGTDGAQSHILMFVNDLQCREMLQELVFQNRKICSKTFFSDLEGDGIS